MKLSDELPEIIRLAKAIQAYWDVELPRRHPNYPFIEKGADDGPPPPEVAELRTLLETLSEEQIYTLLTLQYIGRTHSHLGEWERVSNNMHQAFPRHAQAIAVLLIMPLVGFFLQEALDQVEKAGLDIDNFVLPSVLQA